MSHATPFARQWAGLVAQVRLFGQHAPRATLVEKDGMVASVMPAVPKSSLMNVALTALADFATGALAGGTLPEGVRRLG